MEYFIVIETKLENVGKSFSIDNQEKVFDSKESCYEYINNRKQLWNEYFDETGDVVKYRETDTRFRWDVEDADDGDICNVQLAIETFFTDKKVKINSDNTIG